MNNFEIGETIVMTENVTSWAREPDNWVGTTAAVEYIGNDYIILRSDKDLRPFSLLFPGGTPQNINALLRDAEYP